MSVSYEWKLKKLKQVVESFIGDGVCLTPKEVSTALQAISEMNKMQGHYSAEKRVTINIKADPDLQQIESLVNQHAKEY
jgi:hypothetical protein